LRGKFLLQSGLGHNTGDDVDAKSEESHAEDEEGGMEKAFHRFPSSALM
jgi:hypothetical protein